MNCKARWAAALTMVALLAGGCGGDDGGEETAAEPTGDPRQVVADFYAAVESGDAELICDLISAEDRVPDESGTCEEQVEELVSGPFAEALSSAKVGKVVERGEDAATVEVRIAGERTDAPLVVEDGEWKLDLGE